MLFTPQGGQGSSELQRVQSAGAFQPLGYVTSREISDSLREILRALCLSLFRALYSVQDRGRSRC